MLIALSGGADSVALLLMMLEKGEAEAAAHCNFHLRGEESNRDEAFVRELCREHGVQLFVRHFDTAVEAARTGESLEMAARRLRYAWFDELCTEHGFSGVAVAHHMDDNAETVLLNLVRGTGLRGLCGMAAERNGVVRPLLRLSRKDIMRYLEERHQPYVTDSTNTDTAYRRNFIRHRVMPLLAEMNPQVVASINRAAANLAQAERIYRIGLQRLMDEVCKPLPDGFSIDAEQLAASGVGETLLHEWLTPLGFTAEQVADVATMHVGGLATTQTHAATRTQHTIEVRRLPEPVQPTVLPTTDGIVRLDGSRELHIFHCTRANLLEISRDKNVATLDAKKIIGTLTLRVPEEGERFSPFGMKGRQLVSDFLTNQHASRIDKMKALVAADGEGIAWLVGRRTDNRFAVSDATTDVVILKICEK